MSMKTYAVRLGSPENGERDVIVPSPTDVQAADAARPLMREDESVLSITVLNDAALLDGAPPKTQAAELAPVTPESAAAPEAKTDLENDHG